MAKKVKHPEHVNHERWLVSYADFITLLFAFFTVLYATSQTDSKKTQQFVGSVERAFEIGIFDQGSMSIGFNKTSTSSGDGIYDLGVRLTELQARVDELRKDPASTLSIKTEMRAEGLAIIVQTLDFFEPGSDRVKEQALQSMRDLCAELKKTRNKIRVEGHTDSIPMRGGRFSSNLDLSAARAISVGKILMEHGVSEERLLLSGCAGNQPIQTNKTPEGRAKNRRVELIVLADSAPKHHVKPEPPGPLAEDLRVLFAADHAVVSPIPQKGLHQ